MACDKVRLVMGAGMVNGEQGVIDDKGFVFECLERIGEDDDKDEVGVDGADGDINELCRPIYLIGGEVG